MTFNFNTTASVTANETLQAAEVRIYKSGLTAEEISALEESCDLSKLSVQLYMKIHSNGGANDSVYYVYEINPTVGERRNNC